MKKFTVILSLLIVVMVFSAGCSVNSIANTTANDGLSTTTEKQVDKDRNKKIVIPLPKMTETNRKLQEILKQNKPTEIEQPAQKSETSGSTLKQPKQKENTLKGLPKNIPGQCPDFRNLRTTNVGGIFCQQVADDGTYHNQKHYFYNNKTKKLVEVPHTFYVAIGSKGKELNDLQQEYLEYGEKTNIIYCDGKKYEIPIYENNNRNW